MDQNVIFQQKNNSPTSSEDALDPFAKYENQPSSQIPLPQTPVIPKTSPINPIPEPKVYQPNAIPSPAATPVSSSSAQLPPTPPLQSVAPLPPGPPPPPSLIPEIPGMVKIVGGIIGGILFLLFIIIFLSRFTPHSSQQVTLEYWELWEDKNTMDQVFADFHRQYPNITVHVVKEDPKYYVDTVMTRVKGGNGPDIFTYHNSWVPEFLPLLSPLSTQAITMNDFTSSFYPVAQTDLIHRGAIYGIPLEMDTLSLFVNNNILQAAGVKTPETWDDFNNAVSLTTVKDATGKVKTSGAAIGGYDNIAHASDILAMLFSQNGADQTNLSQTQASAVNALKFYTSFASNWDSTAPEALTVFAQGNTAMYFGYSYDIFALRVLNPTMQFSVYPVPHLLDRKSTIASYWVQGVSVKSTHQKEAMLLMHFLAQKETEEKLYTLESKTRPFGEPYARVDLADTLKDDPLVYPFISQAKTAVSTYFSSNTHDTGINAQMNGYLGNAVRSVLSGNSPDSAISTLSQGVTQILQQYGL